jgi:hypothetical protein
MDYQESPLAEDELKRFFRQLVGAITWCERLGKVSIPPESLRNSELRPPAFGMVPDTGERCRWVERIGGRREELLARRCYGLRPLAGDARASDLAGGRLLLFYPDETLSDGAAELSSYGLFDFDNEPPWDALVWYVPSDRWPEDDRLTSFGVYWIPPQLLDLADAGVQVNPEACIRWADQTDIAFTRSIRWLWQQSAD